MLTCGNGEDKRCIVIREAHCSFALQVLFWKKRAEEAIQRSGLDYTIVRPGGLTDAPRGSEPQGYIVMGGPDTFGLPPRKRGGSILRSQVALALLACPPGPPCRAMNRVLLQLHVDCCVNAISSLNGMCLSSGVIWSCHCMICRWLRWQWRQQSNQQHLARW